LKSPIEWRDGCLKILDQSRLPGEEIFLELKRVDEVAEAIKNLRVRGAPAIGVAAGYGIALGARGISTEDSRQFKNALERVFNSLAATRPTARNLFQVIERMRRAVEGLDEPENIRVLLTSEALAIHAEQRTADESMALLGAGLLETGDSILTHCNTGPLATGGSGTALGIIIRAFEQGKVRQVLTTETRPLLQGTRLTAWELRQAGVPFKLITDSMAGYVMAGGMVDAVIVGADRIAASGDTANKIGTYALAVLAKEHRIPFYVAAPTTTIDKSISTGAEIVIEERSADEVTHIGGVRIAPEGTEVLNPAFDVTPARYITAIITEAEIWRPRG
jgi:methylthioribose-1-phosphate isomerase